ncbi:unnamed protein product [Cunninghamella echinulata]
MNVLDQDNPNPNVAIEQPPRTLTLSDDISNGKPVLSPNDNNTLVFKCNNSSRNIEFAPPRAYLDEAVVPTLLEGMKLLVSERPSNPLAFLGQFLIDRSNSSSSSIE